MIDYISRKFPLPVLISSVLTILPVLTSSVYSGWVINHDEAMSIWNYRDWAIVTIVLAITSALALSPPTLIAVVYGYFLNWAALPYLILLNLLAIALVYVLTRIIDRNHWMDRLQKAYPSLQSSVSRFHENEFRLIFLMKLSPLFPFAVTNLIFALSGARFRMILLGGMLGMFPRTLLAIWIGREGKEIRLLMENPNEETATKILLLALLLISTLGIGYVLRKTIVQKTD